MCLKYFVLALFLDAVASNPYYVPGLTDTKENPNHKSDILRRNENAYLSRNGPSYMSPLPTEKDSEVRNSRYLKGYNPPPTRNQRNISHRIRENKTENEYKKQVSENFVEHVNKTPNNVAISTRSYANPSASFSSINTAMNTLQTVQREKDKTETQHTNYRLESIGHYNNNNYRQPLTIQTSPEQRIAFQAPVLPNISNLETYHPSIPLKGFNENANWSEIAKVHTEGSKFTSERQNNLEQFQQNQMNTGQQAVQSSNNKYSDNHIHEIIGNQRIQNILLSTNQIKRYLVIHPNGSIEHVDSLEPIAAKHPNFILVNSGQMVSNGGRSDTNNNINKMQVPISEPLNTEKRSPISTNQQLNVTPSKERFKSDDINKLPIRITSTVHEKETLNEQTILPETADSSLSTIMADLLKSTTLKADTVIENADIIENQEQEGFEQLQNVELKEESLSEISATPEMVSEDHEINKNTEEAVSNINTSTIEVVTTPENINELQDTVPVIRSTTQTEVVSISGPPYTTTNDSDSTTLKNMNDIPEAKSQATTTSENINVTQEILPIVKSTVETEVIHSTQDDLPLNSGNNQTNDSDSIIVTTQNAGNIENTEANKDNELDSARTGKPAMWFNTSDPDFWSKVTGGKDENLIYFFLVKPSPRIERDMERTIFPNGTILEELTETVWEADGAEPRITKTSKIIDPVVTLANTN